MEFCIVMYLDQSFSTLACYPWKTLFTVLKKNYTIVTIPPYHYFGIHFFPKTCSAHLYKIKNSRIMA